MGHATSATETSVPSAYPPNCSATQRSVRLHSTVRTETALPAKAVGDIIPTPMGPAAATPDMYEGAPRVAVSASATKAASATAWFGRPITKTLTTRNKLAAYAVPPPVGSEAGAWLRTVEVAREMLTADPPSAAVRLSYPKMLTCLARTVLLIKSSEGGRGSATVSVGATVREETLKWTAALHCAPPVRLTKAKVLFRTFVGRWPRVGDDSPPVSGEASSHAAISTEATRPVRAYASVSLSILTSGTKVVVYV